ncbi:hypothetical protein C7445_10313 [Alicyclobacillus sacchari]|uniref:Uncharacterized protein n=1 Tax=Alicyclobacillus sacchari TaxID=392010 RepID=A0A4V6QD33_9BACL|nr:hypothetical protein C7445_10313 [Alicyclobacillus sacchari]GMA57721.1 hypothetical protein GCM10025858_22240 [Alicyclobacillus sacchari]
MYDMAKHQRPPLIVANERCTKQAQVHNSHDMRKDAVIQFTSDLVARQFTVAS